MKIVSSIKKISILCTVLLFNANSPAKVFYPNHLSQETLTPLTNENTLFGFDIHKVLVQKNTWGMAKQGFKNMGMAWHYLRPSVRKHLNELLKQEDIAPEDYIVKLAEKFPKLNLEKYIPGIIELINQQDPIKGMPQLVQNLKNQGFDLYILSNIGPKAFYGWQQVKGLQAKYPQLFAHFTDGVVAAKKPTDNGYIDFKTKFNADNTKHMIFIDDMQRNVDAAVRNGFIGILFTTPDELKKDLNQLGINGI